MDYPLLNQQGSQVDTVQLSDAVFGVTPNEAVVHQALLRQLANLRQGTHSTKTRGEVAGRTKKLFRQKGTGRARQGSIRAPHRRHGGIVFGPKPRSYRQAMPRKMRQLAIRSVLSAKAADGELLLLDNLDLSTAKTRDMKTIMQALKIAGTALVVMAPPSDNVVLAARNLPGVFTLPANIVSVERLLAHKYLVMTLDAARAAEGLWGGAAQGAA